METRSLATQGTVIWRVRARDGVTRWVAYQNTAGGLIDDPPVYQSLSELRKALRMPEPDPQESILVDFLTSASSVIGVLKKKDALDPKLIADLHAATIRVDIALEGVKPLPKIGWWGKRE